MIFVPTGRNSGKWGNFNRFSTAAAVEDLITPQVPITYTKHLINGQFVDAASGLSSLNLTRFFYFATLQNSTTVSFAISYCLRENFSNIWPTHRRSDCSSCWRWCRRYQPCSIGSSQGHWWRTLAKIDCLCRHLNFPIFSLCLKRKELV